MFLYTNKFGQDVLCHGTDDMRKADGVNLDLAKMVVHDEEGQLIGIQGGSLSLQKSMTMIKSLREGEALMKAKQPSVMKKSFAPSMSSGKTEMLKKSFSSGMANLHRQMDAIRRMQG